MTDGNIQLMKIITAIKVESVTFLFESSALLIHIERSEDLFLATVAFQCS